MNAAERAILDLLAFAEEQDAGAARAERIQRPNLAEVRRSRAREARAKARRIAAGDAR